MIFLVSAFDLVSRTMAACNIAEHWHPGIQGGRDFGGLIS